ncbi:hypothetical protein F8S09_04845 [Deinococcus sp. SDU3-2]|uniref:Uncharacterized protein n=1 Tax=Deinococcus terrestris TaxID=2651870 RepID=A0A7X1TQT0_9DEIO|nr:hypothetical protein [Deinococcus terrestris]MPY66025.1 hypothetical protein [Deinococcus terrestris]
MTVSARLRLVSAVTLVLLLAACTIPHVPFQTSDKVAQAERSWHKGGAQHVVAGRYAATLTFTGASSVRAEYAGGTMTLADRSLPPGCHHLPVQAGDRLRLDVTELRLSIPGEPCGE